MIGLAISGLNHLCAPITKLSRGLVELNLARTGITARGVNKLSEALLSNRNIPLNLRIFDLSENSFKGEDVPVSLVTVNLINVMKDLYHTPIMDYSVTAVHSLQLEQR